jgi:hypothetical protein
MKTVLRVAEAGVVRGLPGIASLAALLILADRIGTHDYGYFSTIWATTLFVTSLTFGPISQTIVPCRSRHAQPSEAKRFDEEVIGASLAVSALFLSGAAMASIAGGPILTACALIAVGTGLVQVVQQILQARVALWLYGIVSFSQSACFLIGAYFFPAERIQTIDALYIYALSQVPALAVAFVFLGAPRPARPSAAILSEFKNVGAPLTVGTLAENSLLTCFRWLMAFWASPGLLAAFSFAIDLAQRSVAVVLNLIGFALIPRAYRDFADDPDDRGFRQVLQRSAVTGALVAAAMVVVILVVAGTGMIAALAQPTFVPWIFVTIAVAAVVNRTKKVAVDPIAVRRRRASTIVVGYLVGGGAALTAAAAALMTGRSELVVPIYLAGYCIAALTTLARSSRHYVFQERRA